MAGTDMTPIVANGTVVDGETCYTLGKLYLEADAGRDAANLIAAETADRSSKLLMSGSAALIRATRAVLAARAKTDQVADTAITSNHSMAIEALKDVSVGIGTFRSTGSTASITFDVPLSRKKGHVTPAISPLLRERLGHLGRAVIHNNTTAFLLGDEGKGGHLKIVVEGDYAPGDADPNNQQYARDRADAVADAIDAGSHAEVSIVTGPAQGKIGGVTVSVGPQNPRAAAARELKSFLEGLQQLGQ